MRNLTTLAVDAFAHSEGWHAVAPDTEARDAVYAARALRSADTSLVRLTLARLTHTTHEELASLAVVAAPPTLGVAHELVLFQLLSDGGEAAGNAPALCVITAGGDIVLVPLDAPRAEIVGSVEQGVLAAQWSPDVGSSKMYSVSPRCARCNSVASLTRCASPPESSVAG